MSAAHAVGWSCKTPPSLPNGAVSRCDQHCATAALGAYPGIGQDDEMAVGTGKSPLLE